MLLERLNILSHSGLQFNPLNPETEAQLLCCVKMTPCYAGLERVFIFVSLTVSLRL